MDDLLAQRLLKRLVESPAFSRAGTQRKLLEYFAQAALAGHGKTLTLETLARDVFGGPAKEKEGLVAVTTVRLRTRLAKYYKGEGAADPIQLRIPPRSYGVTLDTVAPTVPEPSAPTQAPISSEDFKELVRDLSKLQGTTREQRDERAKLWVGSSAHYSAIFDAKRPLKSGDEFEDFFKELQKLGEKERFTLPEMRSFAKTLGVHPVLIDPLSSVPSVMDCLSLQLAGAMHDSPQADPERCAVGSFKPIGIAGEKNYGKNARYHIPDVRLQETNLAFVQLVLQPGGSSDVHRHGGQEIMFNLRGGPIEVRLPESGELFRLAQGDYMHFYSEQPHSAHNLSQSDTDILVVRFYQHRPESRRTQPFSREEMQDAVLAAARSGKRTDLDAFTRGWILDATGTFGNRLDSASSSPRGPQEVLNNVGLARFLRRLAKTDEQIVELERLVVDKTTPRGRIEVLKAQFQVDYGPLLYEFLFPAVPWHVMVSRNAAAESHGWVDLEDLVDGQVSDGVKHEIPKRSLACSDIAVTWLTLDPGKVTVSAHHPGSELLVPIEGEATIQLQDIGGVWKDACRVAANGRVGYFDSMKPHRVCNFTRQPVQIFLVRFYATTLGRGDRPDRATEH